MVASGFLFWKIRLPELDAKGKEYEEDNNERKRMEVCSSTRQHERFGVEKIAFQWEMEEGLRGGVGIDGIFTQYQFSQ